MRFIVLRFLAATQKHNQILFNSIRPKKTLPVMKNPLDVQTYQVGQETYRLNCPWNQVNTANPAAAAEFSGGEEMEEAHEEECFSIVEESEEIREIRENPEVEIVEINEEKEVQDGQGSSSQIQAVKKQTQKKRKLKISKEKEQLVVESKRQEEEIQLVGTVKFDSKLEVYHDSLKVVSALIGHLRGRDGHKQKKMEQKYQCTIHFPKKRNARPETDIKIASPHSAQHVQNCREEMETALVQARKQAMPTHFLSVPIFDSTLREQYKQLVERICADEELSKECKNPDIFMPSSKLHLTINVMKLFTDEEVQRVKQFLNTLFESQKISAILADADRIPLEFPALEHFSDRSAEKVAVLFAKAQSETLQKLANAIDDAMCEAGFVEQRKTADVVLHMTVLNTKYLWEKRRTFLNVKPVLEKYGRLHFTAIEVNEIHLCAMEGTNGDEVNGYKSVHVHELRLKKQHCTRC